MQCMYQQIKEGMIQQHSRNKCINVNKSNFIIEDIPRTPKTFKRMTREKNVHESHRYQNKALLQHG